MKRKLEGKELEEVLRDAFDIGDGMAIIETQGGGLTILNTETGICRQFSTSGWLLVSDDEIDFDAMEQGLEHYQRPNKYLWYGGLGRYDDFKNGIAALSWTVYPDGMYFADSDGYGAEDNDEEKAYCIIDRNLDILEPFRPLKNVAKYLENYSENNKK